MHVPPVPPPPVPTPMVQPPMVSSGRGRRTGAAVLVGLVGAALGVALMLSAGLARTATVEGFARAPVGCTTTLQFDRAGVFTLYLETKGSVEQVDGDCSLNGTSYDHQGADASVQTDLSTPDGASVPVETVDLTRRYDTGSYRGTSVGVARISAPGEYRLMVRSEANDVVVAVGGSPDADSRLLQLGGVVAIVLGLLGSLVVMGTGRRRPPSPQLPPARPVLPVQPVQQIHPPQWGPPSV